MSEQKQSLKALRAEAKTLKIKNFSKLSVSFLIDAIKEKKEQDYISDSLDLRKHIVFDTTTPEAKGEPEPVPAVQTIPPALIAETEEKKKRPSRKKKQKTTDPDCSLTLVHTEPLPLSSPPFVADESANKESEKEEKEEITPPADSSEKKKGPNKWQLHVQAFRSEHPELSYKQAMVQAKETYNKN